MKDLSLTIIASFLLMFNYWAEPLGASFERSCAFIPPRLPGQSLIRWVSEYSPWTSSAMLSEWF